MESTTAMQTYRDLRAHLNQAMLAANDQRVPLLRRIMARLDHPDHQFHVIHIAGTNGKGSTGAMLASVLRAQGYEVGRFSSPAISDDREQLQLNGHWISPEAFVATYHEIVPTLTKMGLRSSDVSIFEWFFLIGMVWFRNQGVQWSIVEAGLGGRDDATNALASPQLTIFTKIALDHTQILGRTITAIAENKAEIIKPQTTVVTLNDQDPAALAVIARVARGRGVPLLTASGLVQTVRSQDVLRTVVDSHSQLFDWTALEVSLSGNYQRQNLSLVLTAIAALQRQHVPLSTIAVREGLKHVTLPGRLTVLQTHPLMIADGAHNPDGMRALVTSLQQLLPNRDLIYVLGTLRDKDYRTMLATLLPTAKLVITNTPDNPQRALSASDLAQAALAVQPAGAPEILVQPDITAAVSLAQQRATAKTAIVITGSFYVVRELQRHGWQEALK
ncbi:bifunctional folylpolyglutamate synthase/dihydrofolate synthase [Lactiplantibacillus modestisalitolerans]|uniref:tetrahydrofolate synthase n=1 Tax=Lactiplantibacillus modestisalitolerans TaxID=1457219 RepID=A0ABV5WRT4_9LACO|nr:cyanophycin synthetase [Lactiplantibacillus modestisalitolerans]